MLAFRDLGNREDRKRRAAEVRHRGPGRRLPSGGGAALRCRSAPAPELPPWQHDHLGWHRQDDGRWFLGVPVQSGRVAGGLRAALAEIVEHFELDVRITPAKTCCSPASRRHSGPRSSTSCAATGWRSPTTSRPSAAWPWPARPSPRAGRPWPRRNGWPRRLEGARGRAGRPGPRRARSPRAHDRLPQRVRPAVHGGDRHRRPDQDRLRHPPRWRARRRPPRAGRGPQRQARRPSERARPMAGPLRAGGGPTARRSATSCTVQAP